MGLTHEFYLTNFPALQETEDMIVLHDDLISYIWDSLNWLPTFNASTKEEHSGLHYHGITLIPKNSAPLFKSIILAWCSLFSLGPQTIELTGRYVIDGDGMGNYEKCFFSKDELVKTLSTLAELLDRVQDDNQCILHHGI
ncbi:coproporphyrinogen III oxidase [Brevibacillus fluminis]|uniref:Coproporphyrinogen III oxidase n=1 Tax=Brevibacillus fluminis TaxID=511487 RepID=A0A3M8DNJ5_9BACL|nr:coproporphyrinogen III oxidase [Brevibacillus fluminis]RNB89670.1 coproporphyrinogen III oxidase [Brevibacillus fluminis]